MSSFQSLERSASRVCDALRRDETSFYNSVSSSSGGNDVNHGNQTNHQEKHHQAHIAPLDMKDLLTVNTKYYIRTPTSTVTDNFSHQIEERNFYPIPRAIKAQIWAEGTFTSFSGILPEIQKAWITKDNVLYLWDYSNGHDSDDAYKVYEGINEVIYSVTAVCPKADPFPLSVAYILVVITPVEIVLLAVMKDDHKSMANRDGVFQLKSIARTHYATSTDNLTFLAIAGSSTGRIFLAGSDCNLYEFDYKDLRSSWSAYWGIGSNYSCKKRKLNTGINSFFSFLTNGFTVEAEIPMSLLVDDVRKLLYAISKSGKVAVFYIPSDEDELIYIKTVNLMERAKAKRDVASSTFTREDEVIGLFNITNEESSKLHGMVVLNTGVRIYFSLKGRDGKSYLPSASRSTPPYDLDVEIVRLPYSANEAQKLKTGNDYAEAGFLPAPPPTAKELQKSDRQISKALYSNGSLLAVVGSGPRNMLVNAKLEYAFLNPLQDGNCEARENLCALFRSRDDVLFEECIHDIKEVPGHLYDLESSRIRRLFYASETPHDHYNGSNTSNKKGDALKIESVPGPAPVLPYLGRERNSGYTNDDLAFLCKQTELTSSMIPSLSMSQRQFALLTDQGVYIIVQRRPIDYLYALLVSSCDERSCSSSKMLDIKRRIFEYYGLSQSCAMCIGIACDLPYDITSTISGDFNAHYSSSLQVNDTVKRNAIIVMKQISQSTNPARGEPQILDDGKIVWSTTFHALYQVFSRIVRPIWYRNLIGPDPKNRSKSLPILTTSEFQALLEPLKKLAQIIKIHHRDAIEYASGDRTGSVDNKMSEARVEENKLLNDFYRLVSRTIQAIRVIQIILEAQSVQKLSVKWSDLCNATFMKFVTNSSSHSRIKHGLQRMVCVKNPPPVLTHIMHKLARECFFFFSIGSVHKYHGVNELRKAEDAPQFSQKRDQHTAIAINELCKPGIEWDSILYDKDNTDQSLRTVCNNFLKLGELGQLGVVNVCISAAEGFMGTYFDKGGGIAGNNRLNISIVMSDDFNNVAFDWERSLYRGETTLKSPENSTIERRDKEIIRRLRRIIFDTSSKMKWSELREDLQHILEGADVENILSSYENNIVSARGSSVEKVDTYLESRTDMKLFEWIGKMDCYAVLFSKIKQVQEAEYIPVGVGAVLHDFLISTDSSCKSMIHRAVECTKDHDFHQLLHSFLVKNNMSDFLLDLKTVHVENFLREEDPLRLYHYFCEHQRYHDAMDLMMRLACTDDEEDIQSRVEYFNNAIDSAEKSRKGMITGGSSGKQFRTTSEAIVSLREKLKMAIFQQNLANQINYLRNFTIPKNPEDSNIALFGDLWKKVNYSIMEYSDMFNEITQPFGLWEESLQILNICNYQDEELVKRLWLSIMVG